MYYVLLLLLSIALTVTASPLLDPKQFPLIDSSINSPPLSPSTPLDPSYSPRPDRTPFYDPREHGGSMLNVRNLEAPLCSELRKGKLISDPLNEVVEESMGRRWTIKRHHQRSIESRRIEEEWFDRTLEKFRSVSLTSSHWSRTHSLADD